MKLVSVARACGLHGHARCICSEVLHESFEFGYAGEYYAAMYVFSSRDQFSRCYQIPGLAYLFR